MKRNTLFSLRTVAHSFRRLQPLRLVLNVPGEICEESFFGYHSSFWSLMAVSGKLFEAGLACVASVSIWFRSKKDSGRGSSVLTARSLTLVPCSLLLNHTETLATQAKAGCLLTFSALDGRLFE